MTHVTPQQRILPECLISNFNFLVTTINRARTQDPSHFTSFPDPQKLLDQEIPLEKIKEILNRQIPAVATEPSSTLITGNHSYPLSVGITYVIIKSALNALDTLACPMCPLFALENYHEENFSSSSQCSQEAQKKWAFSHKIQWL